MFIQPLKHLLVTLPRIRSSLLDKTVAARIDENAMRHTVREPQSELMSSQKMMGSP
jgi:hypothetical protein